MKIAPQKLQHLIAQIFLGVGCGQREAEVVADHLVKANLSGHDSHGVIRAPIYIQWMKSGRVFPGKKMAGRYGGSKVTIRKLKVVRVDASRNLLLIKGAVPGKPGTLLSIVPTKKVGG